MVEAIIVFSVYVWFLSSPKLLDRVSHQPGLGKETSSIVYPITLSHQYEQLYY